MSTSRSTHLFTTTVDNTKAITSLEREQEEQKGNISKNVSIFEDSNEKQIKGTDQEKLTSDLIRKQVIEIEKDISRRMQNKNVKKVCFFRKAIRFND